MQYEIFKSLLIHAIRKRIESEDEVRIDTAGNGMECIAVIPCKYKDRVFPAIQLREFFQEFLEGHANIDNIADSLLFISSSLWDHAIANDIRCLQCDADAENQIS